VITLPLPWNLFYLLIQFDRDHKQGNNLTDTVIADRGGRQHLTVLRIRSINVH
jgi:hypothetical protein